MRKILLIISIQLIFICCEQKKEKNVIGIKPENEFSKAIRKSTKVSVLIKKENQHEYSRDDSAFVQKESFATKNQTQIQDFKKLFKNSVKTAYCCCPKTDYMIVFYRNDEKLDFYFVNKTEIRDSVIVFQQSYQSSQKIKKSEWNNFMDKVKLK